jgi:hypothetical protein
MCRKEGEEKRREEGEKKTKKGKEKNKMRKFSNLKISDEKNKRQFTELV